jgi:hypothetical protein
VGRQGISKALIALCLGLEMTRTPRNMRGKQHVHSWSNTIHLPHRNRLGTQYQEEEVTLESDYESFVSFHETNPKLQIHRCRYFFPPKFSNCRHPLLLQRPDQRASFFFSC